MKNDKINIFSKSGLQRMFPTAKIKRKYDLNGGRWVVEFPFPKDYKELRAIAGVRKVIGTESVVMEDSLWHEVDTKDYLYHMPNCQYCVRRKQK